MRRLVPARELCSGAGALPKSSTKQMGCQPGGKRVTRSGYGFFARLFIVVKSAMTGVRPAV